MDLKQILTPNWWLHKRLNAKEWEFLFYYEWPLVNGDKGPNITAIKVEGLYNGKQILEYTKKLENVTCGVTDGELTNYCRVTLIEMFNKLMCDFITEMY